MMSSLFSKCLGVVTTIALLLFVLGCSKKEEAEKNPPPSTNVEQPVTKLDEPTKEPVAEAEKDDPLKSMPKMDPLSNAQKDQRIKDWESKIVTHKTSPNISVIDMPTYPGSKVTSLLKEEPSRKIYYYNMVTKDDYKTVLDWYKGKLKNVEEKADGSTFAISGKSGNGLDTLVTARPWQDGTMTLIVIVATKPK